MPEDPTPEEQPPAVAPVQMTAPQPESPAAAETPDSATPAIAAEPAGPAPAPTCNACGTEAVAGDVFCEGCGTPLGASAPAPVEQAADVRTHRIQPTPAAVAGPPEHIEPVRTCVPCGAPIDTDGYCTVCGTPAPKERDHWAETPAAWVAGVCDRGIRHARNEDAMALAAEPTAGTFAVLVVCDGVTTADASDVASLAAARAARDALAAAKPASATSPAATIVHWSNQLVVASLAANEQASAVAATVPNSTEPPSCTFVAAVVHGTSIVAGWVGDSRAYWLPDHGPATQLSIDDSWATDQIALGVPRDVAEADNRAHSITRWLGIDAPDANARTTSTTVEGAGWLLVCSDGLWNYCSPAADLRGLIDGFAEACDSDPEIIADGLVAWANDQGGVDNITVALARVPSPTNPAPSITSAGN